MLNSSLWGWELGLQRDGLLHSQGMVCCGVTSEGHSFLTAPYGVGSVDFRGMVCCMVKGRDAVEPRARDTQLYQFPMGLEAWTSEG